MDPADDTDAETSRYIDHDGIAISKPSVLGKFPSADCFDWGISVVRGLENYYLVWFKGETAYIQPGHLGSGKVGRYCKLGDALREVSRSELSVIDASMIFDAGDTGELVLWRFLAEDDEE